MNKTILLFGLLLNFVLLIGICFFVFMTDPSEVDIGAWDHYEIQYQSGRLWVLVNGALVQDAVNLNDFEQLKNRSDLGSIAIQRNDYKKSVYFKNLRIKRLQI